MLLKSTVAEMIVKLDPTIYRKHIWYNKNPCYMYSLKSLIWNSPSRTTVLETSSGDITGVGFHTEPI